MAKKGEKAGGLKSYQKAVRMGLIRHGEKFTASARAAVGAKKSKKGEKAGGSFGRYPGGGLSARDVAMIGAAVAQAVKPPRKKSKRRSVSAMSGVRAFRTPSAVSAMSGVRAFRTPSAVSSGLGRYKSAAERLAELDLEARLKTLEESKKAKEAQRRMQEAEAEVFEAARIAELSSEQYRSERETREKARAAADRAKKIEAFYKKMGIV
jgi:hypothetical protein